MDNYMNRMVQPQFLPAPCSHLKWAIIVLLFLSVSFIGCNRKPPSDDTLAVNNETNPKSSKIIVALGDSLTAGLGVDETQTYPAQLEQKLVTNGHAIRVINAGISGETSSGTLSRIQWVISSLKPDMVILVIGANDGMRGIDTALLSRNLDNMITTLKENNIKVLLGGMQMLPNLGPVYAREFEQVYPKMAHTHHVMLIPFFLEGVGGENKFNQSDGIHPTAEGYSIIANHIYPYVLEVVDEK